MPYSKANAHNAPSENHERAFLAFADACSQDLSPSTSAPMREIKGAKLKTISISMYDNACGNIRQ